MVQILQQQDVTVLKLGASYESLDEDQLDDFGGTLLTEAATVEPPQMVLDLSATQLIGSRFIELMIRAWKRLNERGGTMVLCGVHPFCAEVLHVTRLDTLWETYPDECQAVAALKLRSPKAPAAPDNDQATGRR